VSPAAQQGLAADGRNTLVMAPRLSPPLKPTPLGAYLLLRNVKYPKANFIARPSVDKLCTLWRQVLTENFSHKE
jgi:hypothetical protein